MGDSIVIDTVLSTKGFQKGSAELKSAITSLTKTAKNMAMSIKSIVPSIIGVSSAFGVIQKAIGTYMSQHEVVSRKMEAVWTALGNLVGPIVEKVVDWVRSAVSYFIEFLRVLGLTGKTASQLSQKALNSTDTLKRTIAGFDELNVMNDTREFPLEDKKLPDWLKNLLDMLKNGEWEKLALWLANKINEIINNTDWEALGKKFAYYFAKLINSPALFIKTIDFHTLGKKLAEFLNQVFALDADTWKNLGLLLVAGFTVPFDILTGFLEDFNPVDLAKAISNVIIGALESLTKSVAGADWVTIGQNIIKLFENIDWAGIAKAVWDLFTSALDAASKLSSSLPDWVKEVGIGLLSIKATSDGVSTINSLAKSIERINKLEAVGPLEKIGQVIHIVTTKAGTLKDAMQYTFGPGSVLAGIAGLIGGTIIAVKNFFDMWENGFSWLKEILMGIGIAIAAVAATILGIPGIAAAIVAAVIAAVATAAVLIKEHWAEITEWFKNTWDSISKWWNDLCDSITEWWVDKIDIINKSIDDFSNRAKQKFDDFKQSCMDVINNIKNAFKNGVNGVIGFFNGLISGAIGGINALIGAINRLSFTVPSWVPEIGGATIGFNIPPVSAKLIPYLAEGGVLKKGQVGLLEGSGAEAVVPLEKNTEWINKVADAFLARLNGGQYSIGDTKALAAIDAIANAVAYRMPAIAAGGVTPYSVSMGGTMARGYGISGESELLNELRGLREDIMYLSEHMQFVADFGDGIRALARKITKEQRRNQISEGR